MKNLGKYNDVSLPSPAIDFTTLFTPTHQIFTNVDHKKTIATHLANPEQPRQHAATPQLFKILKISATLSNTPPIGCNSHDVKLGDRWRSPTDSATLSNIWQHLGRITHQIRKSQRLVAESGRELPTRSAPLVQPYEQERPARRATQATPGRSAVLSVFILEKTR